jgi:hypothetical protein
MNFLLSVNVEKGGIGIGSAEKMQRNIPADCLYIG